MFVSLGMIHSRTRKPIKNKLARRKARIKDFAAIFISTIRPRIALLSGRHRFLRFYFNQKLHLTDYTSRETMGQTGRTYALTTYT